MTLSWQQFYGYDTPSTVTKGKINEWNYIKLKKHLQNQRVNKVKKQPMKWEKISANHISDKGLICKIYEKLIQQEKTIQFENGQKI